MPKILQNNATEAYVLHESNMVVFKGMVRGMAWRLFNPGNPEFMTVRRCNTTQMDQEAPDFCKSMDRDDQDIVPGNTDRNKTVCHQCSVKLCILSLQSLF